MIVRFVTIIISIALGRFNGIGRARSDVTGTMETFPSSSGILSYRRSNLIYSSIVLFDLLFRIEINQV